MKARMTVDPRLLRLIGDKLYSSHPLPIVVRELLQNARDACVRKGTETKVRIAIKHHYQDGEYFIVECEDRGIGMTESQLLNDFLCLGNTSKIDDEGAVGGFGIAKAAIMRNPEWSVHTLDNYVDQKIIYEGGEIQKTDYLDGTKVTVKITDPVYRWTLYHTLQMIYLSDIDVDLEANYRDHNYNDPHAGWKNWEKSKMYADENWEAYKFDEVNMFGEEISGISVFRLSGLAQFVNQSYSNRKFNIVVDIKTNNLRPDDKEYPFTLSREGLAPMLRANVDKLIDEADANPISTTIKVKTMEDNPTIEIREGYFLRGKRNIPEGIEISILDDLTKKHYRDVLRADDNEQYKHQALYFEGYDELARNIRKDYGILKLWREILVLCADWYDQFGVGLVINEHMNAARITTNGNVFYVINPDSVTGTLNAQISTIHFMACHEAAHYGHTNHDEMHSVEQTNIFKETIEEVVSRNAEFRKILRGI